MPKKTGQITPNGVIHAFRIDKRDLTQTECGWVNTCYHYPLKRGGKVTCRLCKQYLKHRKMIENRCRTQRKRNK